MFVFVFFSLLSVRRKLHTFKAHRAPHTTGVVNVLANQLRASEGNDTAAAIANLLEVLVAKELAIADVTH